MLTETLNDSQQAIVQWLTMLRDICRGNGLPKDYTYAGTGDFLLQHGVWYTPAPLPARVKRRTPTQCFRNALALARRSNYKYIEGYALPDIDDVSLPMLHAWNLDRKGNLIDSTWRKEGLAYLGVEFAPQRIASLLRVNDSVFEAPRTRFEIFRDPWTGEVVP